MKKYILLPFFVLLLQGCFFPVAHTIYSPKSEEGTLSSPAPCGFLTDKSKLRIFRKNFKASFHMSDSNEKLYVSFMISPESNHNMINFNKVKLIYKNKVYLPIRIVRIFNTSNWEPTVNSENELIDTFDETHKYIFTYVLNILENESILFRIENGGLKLNNKDIDIKDIIFKKEVVPDVYMLTINC